MVFVEWVQRSLIAHGFNPGIVDGVWGRNTLGATMAFQKARGLPSEGALNNATVSMLRLSPAGAMTSDKEPPKSDLLDRMPWMALAKRKIGLHEKEDNFELRKFLKSDGPTLGDPAQNPWCGDFVETCIAVTLTGEVLPNNPYLARNWLKFGQTVDAVFGSILVFWRISKTGSFGHVGFYYSEDADTFHVLGGNQSNAITITKISKNRLLGARLPFTGGPYPRKVVKKSSDWELSENEF